MLHNATIRNSASVLSCLCMMMQAANNAFADDSSMVAPFIGESTAIVIKVDPTKLALPELPVPLPPEFSQRVQDFTNSVQTLRAATAGQPIYATIGIPLSKSEWPAFLFVRETPKSNREQLVELLSTLHEMHSFSQDGVTVLMPGGDFDPEASLKRLVPSPRSELSAAFEAVKEYPIQVLLLPPDYVRRTVADLMPQLPKQLGGGPSSLLTEGLMWAAIGIDPAQPAIELVIQSESEPAAQALAANTPKILQALYDESGESTQQQIPNHVFRQLLPLIEPQVTGDQIKIRLAGQHFREFTKLMAIVPTVVSEQIRQQRNSNNFKSILLGMHNYHDTYKMFPPRDGVRDANGKTGLSWRVHVLPFLGENKLYIEFNMDEPWDSAHNKPLLKKMPDVFKSKWLGIKPGHTTFLAPIGEDTIFGGEKATRIANIRDGTSNTVALIEVKPSLSVPWTAPQDYVFDLKDPSSGLRLDADGRFLAALADGSVNRFVGKIPADVLLRLFQKSDGEPVDWTELR